MADAKRTASDQQELSGDQVCSEAERTEGSFVLVGGDVTQHIPTTPNTDC